LACYDLSRLADRLERDEFIRAPVGLWRWAELLPVFDPAKRITLGEGGTPLIGAPRLGKFLGLDSIYIKDEGRNPTGSFKARGLAVAVSKAVELGVQEFAMPTAGNAGGALAAYAARGGFRAHVFMPANSPQVNQEEVRAAGIDLILVDGLIDRAGRMANSQAKEHGWFNLSTFKEPYRVEGKKTLGFEIAAAFDWSLPDLILYPTGGGTGLVGMWKAFHELKALNWIQGSLPRMIAVQPEGCAPIVRALEEGDKRVCKWQETDTLAVGLRVPKPFADRLALNAVRESGGTGIAVSDEEICQAQEDLASMEGVLACPEGAATLAGLRRLCDSGEVRAEDRVVLFNTASGLKYLSSDRNIV
jgi:threonine synthase